MVRPYIFRQVWKEYEACDDDEMQPRRIIACVGS